MTQGDLEGKKTQLVGFGHSHISTYLRAWMSRQKNETTGDNNISFVRLGHKNFGENFETIDRVRQVSPLLQRRIIHILRRDKPDAIFCALMGNEYNSLAMVRHPEPFAVEHPSIGPVLSEAGETLPVIPYALMRAQLSEVAENNALLLWRAITKEADCPVYLLPPPPPIASETHIKQFPGQFGKLVKKFGLNPPETRRKMWLTYRDVLRAAAAADPDTTFIDLPDEIFENGFLAERFWQGDPTHANEGYGQIMLDRIFAMAF